MKDIMGFEGLYAITEHGKVWSYPKKWGGKTPNQTHRGKWLAHSKKPYPTVSLCKNGKIKNFLIHRLVAQAFIPNPTNLPQVNHINGDATDNRVENLEWCDQTYNVRHNIVLGRTARGTKAHFAKLTPTKVRKLRKKFSEGTSKSALSIEFKVSLTAVCSILDGKNWGWLK